MRFFERAGWEAVAAVFALLMWINSIQRGNVVDVSTFFFGLFAWRVYRKLSAQKITDKPLR